MTGKSEEFGRILEDTPPEGAQAMLELMLLMVPEEVSRPAYELRDKLLGILSAYKDIEKGAMIAETGFMLAHFEVAKARRIANGEE